MTPAPATSAVHRALRVFVDVGADEVAGMCMSFGYFFCVMSAWFVLRPIRDAVAAASGASKLPWLFMGTLTVTLIVNPMFSSLVARFHARRVISISYHFFVACLLIFYAGLRLAGAAEGSTLDVWLGRGFYVWTSMFNLFVISIFWSFMADVFTSDQAKRMFGFIGVGGTLGSIAGSVFTAAMATRIGTTNLFFVSAILLELAVLLVVKFPKTTRPAEERAGELEHRDQPIGGSAWGGLTRVMASPYLLGVSGFLLLYILGSTVLYAEQSDFVGRLFSNRDARTTVLAQMDFAAQSLTVLIQIFFTGRIIRLIGLGATLAVIPVVSTIGFALTGVWPVFAALAVFIVFRRAANYSLMNPAMETLFTVVSREDKYKAKSFIETFIYRFSDQLTIWAYAGLAALGLGMSGIALTVAPVAAVSIVLALWLGRRQVALAATRSPAHAAPAGSIRFDVENRVSHT